MAATDRPGRDVVIRSEADAWDLLKRLEAGDYASEAIVPQFEGWPNSEVTFWLGSEHETLTAPMMEAMLDVQTSVYRSYMLVEEGTTSLRSLTNEQRKELEVKFPVGQGCTKLLPDLQEIAEKFAQSAVKHMSGNQITIVILVFVLAIASNAFFRTWLEHRTKRAQSDSSSKQVQELLSAQRYASDADIEKTRLLVEMSERAMGTRALVDASDESKQGLLKGASKVDATEIAGVEIQPEVARRVARAPRVETEDERIEGRYRVLRVDTDAEDGYRVRLQDIDTEHSFFATVRDALVSNDDRQEIASAEWGKYPIWASIATRKRRGEIVQAVVTAVRKFEAN